MSTHDDALGRGLSRRHLLRNAGVAAAGAGLLGMTGLDGLDGIARAATRAAPLPPPNGGKPITITMWTPWPAPEPHYPQFTKWIAAYHQAYPTVTVKLVALPWAEHWTKLQAAAVTGSGPDLDAMHIAYFGQFYDAGLLAPYPASLFPQAQLKRDYPLYPLVVGPDGKQYLWPEDAAVGFMLYNKAVWRQAGLSEKDAPKTWDDVKRLAKELTVRTNGQVTRYGYSRGIYPPSWFLWDAYYQQGQYQFSADGQQAIFNNEAMVRSIMLDKELVGTYGSYTGDAAAQMGQGKVALMRGWEWMIGIATQANPKAEIGVLPLPTWDGKAGIYGQGVLQVGFGVMAKAPADRQEAAFHFIHWLFMTGDRAKTAVDYALLDGGIPAYAPAAAQAQFPGADIARGVLARAIYYQDYPPIIETALDRAASQIERAGAQPSAALAEAVRVANRTLRQQPGLFYERAKLF